MNRKPLQLGATLLVSAALTLACATVTGPAELPPGDGQVTLGTFDSRAVLMAWLGSDIGRTSMDRLHKQLEQAQAAEDDVRIAELEEMGQQLQQEEQATGVLHTAQQQQEIDNFRVQMLDTRRDLRDVQRSLRTDVETLESRIRVVNIWAVPIVIAIVAVLLALVRRMRRARFYRAALH